MIIQNPAQLFQEFELAGQGELKDLRAEVSKPNKNKQPRTWGITEASRMIGRSDTWLRDADPNCPTDERGNKRWTLQRINAIRKKIGWPSPRPEGARGFVLAITNFKGGVGKTTTTIHLAQYAAIQGLNVAVIDLDSQASATFNLTNLIPDVDLGKDDVPYDAMLSNPEDFRYTMRESYFTGVAVSPANLYLQNLEIDLADPELNHQDTLGTRYIRLLKCLEPLKDVFDLILIDCPPNMGLLTSNAILAADGLLLPVPPKAFDRASFNLLCGSLRRIFSQVKKPLGYLRVLPTVHPGTKTSREEEKKMRARLGEYVTASCMYLSTEIEKASVQLSSIYDLEKPMDKKETYLRALDCMNAVNQEILDDIVEYWKQSVGEVTNEQ